MAMSGLDITPEQQKTLLALLGRFLPGVTVWAYGSRVQGTARRYSDLDLVAFVTPEHRPRVAELKEALEESDLPYPVDLLIWDELPERFRPNIEARHVVIQVGNGADESFRKVIEGERVVVQATCEQFGKPTKLGKITSWLSGGTPAKSKAEFWGGEIPWISAASMETTRLYDSPSRITQKGLEAGSRLAPLNSTLLLVRGSALHKVVPMGIAEREVAFNQDVKAITAKKGLHPKYLFFWFLAKRPELLEMVEFTGIGAGKFDTNTLKNLPFDLPDIDEQERIIGLIGALDDRIELNRRMNETLEAMARALFKDWFVDFGPTRAKAEGRPAYLAPEIWDLFPDALDDEDKPVGWEIGNLLDLADLHPESWSKKNPPQSVEYVDLANTKWGTIESTQFFEWAKAPSRAQRILRPGDTIVGTVRPGNGSYSLVGRDGLTGSTGFAVLRPKTPACRELVYLAATSKDNIERLTHLADGAAYPAVRPNVVGETELPLPGGKNVEAFSSATHHLVDRMEANKQESQTLAQLRDLLLPKLMTGEIRVRDAEKAVEAAL